MNQTIGSLELRDVSVSGEDGEVLRNFSTCFAPGRFHVLRGPTGGGKDVLLRVLGLLQSPGSGDVLVHGMPTRDLSEEARAELRTQRFGFVFTAPFLLTSFSVIENVAMPLFKVSQVSPDEARRRTEEMLTFVGVAEAAEFPIEELPPLQQYQVAVARGLINEPSFLLVENLDGILNSEELSHFVNLLRRAGEAWQTTIIATASHAVSLPMGARVLDISDGSIAGDSELQPETGL